MPATATRTAIPDATLPLHQQRHVRRKRWQGPPRNPNTPIDFTYRRIPPVEREDALTRLGHLKDGMECPDLARLQWYILRAAPNSEVTAAVLLEGQGCTVILPREVISHQCNRYTKKKRWVFKPLMLGYLFVGFAAQPNWPRTLAWPCVGGVVAVQGAPMQVSFAALKAFIRANPERKPKDQPNRMPTGREYDVGDEVEILDGPFSGQRAKVRKIRANVADVLLSLSKGGGASAKFPLDNLGNLR